MSFHTLGLSAPLVQAVEDEGYSKPTPIQSQAIPIILEKHDLLACAQTGTGKTAGFTLPLLERLKVTSALANERAGARPVRALILTPTRELAAQVGQSVTNYGKHLSLKSAIIFGGVNINRQINQLRSGVDIIIATPGRLLDHLSQKTVDLSAVEILVLDEADRMLDMGFIHNIRKIITFLPKKRQNLLFSATFSDEIRQLANGLLRSPKRVDVTPAQNPRELISQVMHPVDTKRKRDLLSHIIASQTMQQVLVFTRTKHGANKLSDHLTKTGITSVAIHGNKSQSARTKALQDFKQGDVRTLVATDIAARGLDIDQLPHVVNYDLPQVAEDYVHRIGRTGRAGSSGQAISLVSIDEHKLLKDIENLLKKPIPNVVVAGFEPDPTIKAEPILRGRQNRPPKQSGSSKQSNSSKQNCSLNQRAQSKQHRPWKGRSD